jgi:hypothetical protein
MEPKNEQMWTQPQETWGYGEKFLVFHHKRRQLTRPLMIHKQNGFQELLWRLLGEKTRTVLCLDDRFLVTAKMEASQWKHGTTCCKSQKMSRNTPEKGLWEDDHCDFHQLSMLYHVRRGMNSCGKNGIAATPMGEKNRVQFDSKAWSISGTLFLFSHQCHNSFTCSHHLSSFASISASLLVPSGKLT